MESRAITVLIGFLLCQLVAAKEVPDAAPYLTLSRKVIDFGKRVCAQKADASFVVGNLGPGKLVISSVKRGCGCLEAKLPKMQLMPGENMNVKVSLAFRTMRGKRAKIRLVLETNDPDQPRAVITFVADVSSDLDWSPFMVDIKRASPRVSQTTRAELVISGKLRTKITRAECNLPFIKAVPIEEGGRQFIQISTLPPLDPVAYRPHLAEGKYSGTITATTDHPLYSPLKLRIDVEFDEIINISNELRIISNGGKYPHNPALYLNPYRMKEHISIKRIDVPDQRIRTKVTKEPKGTATDEVIHEISFPDFPEDPALDGKEITIHTDSKLYPKIRVKVRVQPPQQSPRPR